MTGKKTLETRMASMPEVLGILEDRQKSGELGYEQQLVLEHATKFAKLKESDAKKLKKELEEAGLSERLALKVIEIMPTEPNLFRLILAMDTDRQPASDEEVGKLVELVKGYSK
jgi:DNA-directed RNA polymerase subunit F